MGVRPGGKLSRLMARELLTRSVHCQSQFGSVGNSARAGELVLHQRPSIRLQFGPIRAFQKIGTRANGGLHQLKSARRGVSKTLPPVASFASAARQELVMKTSFGTDSETCAGYSQKFQSFS